MDAWNFPGAIVLALGVAVAASLWLLRVSQGPSKGPAFLCSVCGRKEFGLSAKDWRYCPYCGAPKDALGTKDMPKRKSRYETV